MDSRRPLLTPVPFAVLGDSDSHSYHDTIRIPETSLKRGGAHRATTWQWTECLARLRGRYVDQGEWGTWGTRDKIARLSHWLGWEARAPRKIDYRYNFAVSGADSHDLMIGPYRQAPRLLHLMNGDPERWKAGIVLIRIGVNTIGKASALDRFATEGVTPAVTSEVLECASWIGRAIDLISHNHPQTRFVVVGILDNSDSPPYFGRWMNVSDREAITAALDLFDNSLRAFADRDLRVAFFDDRAWFRGVLGGRGIDGQPAYRSVSLGGHAVVTNTMGDEPVHAVLADGHAGTVWNALWAAGLVRFLNSVFELEIPPVSIDEVGSLVDPTDDFGMRPTSVA